MWVGMWTHGWTDAEHINWLCPACGAFLGATRTADAPDDTIAA